MSDDPQRGHLPPSIQEQILRQAHLTVIESYEKNGETWARCSFTIPEEVAEEWKDKHKDGGAPGDGTDGYGGGA